MAQITTHVKSINGLVCSSDDGFLEAMSLGESWRSNTSRREWERKQCHRHIFHRKNWEQRQACVWAMVLGLCANLICESNTAGRQGWREAAWATSWRPLQVHKFGLYSEWGMKSERNEMEERSLGWGTEKCLLILEHHYRRRDTAGGSRMQSWQQH